MHMAWKEGNKNTFRNSIHTTDQREMKSPGRRRMNSSMTYAMIEVRTKFFGNIVGEKLSMF